MLRDLIPCLFGRCFDAIGGLADGDVRYILNERPKEVSRDRFFLEAAWAVMVSGIARKSAGPFSERATECGFSWNYEETAGWSDSCWLDFYNKLYPNGLTDRGGKKWAAIRSFARELASFSDEPAFREEYFSGKTRSADLCEKDVERLTARRLPWIRRTNAQYILRNIGGEFIKCDRWINELLKYLAIRMSQLQEELAAAGISLALFDVVIWKYCEQFVKRVEDFGPHFGRLLS
jgi:hypothetical protein